MADTLTPEALNEQGWRRGLANFLRKENAQWWHTRRWWLQALVWVLILNGTVGIVLWVVPLVYPDKAETTIDSLPGFFELLILIPMFSVIIGLQGAVIDEKLSGTAAWILSAPVSRSAFILAKLTANTLAFAATILVIPGLIALVQISITQRELLPITPFVVNLGLMGMYFFFYLTLTLMLGTFFDSRGPVLAISVGVALASLKGVGPLAASVAPAVVPYLPEALPEIVRARVAGTAVPDSWPTTVIAMLLYAELFVAAAIWRFEREEF